MNAFKMRTIFKIFLILLPLIVWLAVYSIPALVILNVINISAKVLAWIMIVLLVLMGANRLFNLLFRKNNIYSIRR